MLALLTLAACSLAACSERTEFQNPDDWIRALNEQGVRCRSFHAKAPLPAQAEQGNCRLNNGDILTVLIVNDGKRYFEKNFSGRHGPTRFFYRDNWVVAGPLSIPPETIKAIRRLGSVS
jgi:hypothetical protein